MVFLLIAFFLLREMNAFCLLLGIAVAFGVNVLSSRDRPTKVFNRWRCQKLIAFLTSGIVMNGDVRS